MCSSRCRSRPPGRSMLSRPNTDNAPPKEEFHHPVVALKSEWHSFAAIAHIACFFVGDHGLQTSDSSFATVTTGRKTCASISASASVLVSACRTKQVPRKPTPPWRDPLPRTAKDKNPKSVSPTPQKTQDPTPGPSTPSPNSLRTFSLAPTGHSA
jgi:hypothetical protein